MDSRNEFMSLYELGNYLNSNDHSYDLSIPISQSGLLDEIDLLHARGRINSVFYYEGIAKLTIFNPKELDQSKNTMSFDSVPVKGYFYDSDLHLLFKKPCENNSFKGIYEPFLMDQDVFDFLDLVPKDYLAGLNDSILDMKLIYELKIDKNKYSEKDLLFIIYKKLKATDSLTIGTPSVTQNEVKRAKERIADLEIQLVKVEAELEDKPADDLKDVPHQSYRTIDRVMYAMAKLTELDNSKPYSQNNPSLNASITTILQNDGLPLEHEAVGKWLSRINDIKPLN